jgi:hypothetical protein
MTLLIIPPGLIAFFAIESIIGYSSLPDGDPMSIEAVNPYQNSITCRKAWRKPANSCPAMPVARPFMGGTDVFVRMRDGFWREKYIVDVKGLDGTNDINSTRSRIDPGRSGEYEPRDRIAGDPGALSVLVEACRTVAHQATHPGDHRREHLQRPRRR